MNFLFLILVLPIITALAILLLPRDKGFSLSIKYIALAGSLLNFLLSIGLWIFFSIILHHISNTV
jgi:NADH:ubiquinone oxidoreductase subunit 4 (subunit M)